MSIFGSRKKTTVGTSVARVIEDDMVSNSIKQGAVQAIMDRSSATTDYVMEELVSGLATRADRFYRFGRDKYQYGLPSAQAMSTITGRPVVENALRAAVGEFTSISYYKLGAINLLHVGWMKLVNEYGYDSTDNTMTVDGRKVWLVNMQPVVVESNFGEIENGSMDVWGTPPSAGESPAKKWAISNYGILDVPPAFIIDSTATEDHVRVTYCWEVDDAKESEGIIIPIKKVEEQTMTLSMAGFSDSANYFQIRYMQGGKAGYWTYQLNSGVNPQVEAIFDTPSSEAGTYFPWGYFRFDKKAENADTHSVAFRNSKQLLNTLSMNLDELCTSINENPDIADVEQAMLMMAVPANTKNEMERKYLFDWFSQMYIAAKATDGAADNPAVPLIRKGLDKGLNQTSIILRDKRFKMAISFTSIIKRRVAGKIGNPGEHDSGMNKANVTNKAFDQETQTDVAWITQVPTHYYRRQITENVYEELLITGLKSVYWIWGDYTDTADETEDILLIPLDYDITSKYQMFDKEELYARSLHYIFNSRVVTKLKWYQTGIFKAVLIVVSIVIMVFNIAAGMKALSTALAAGATLSALAYMVLIAVVKYVLVTVAVRLFVKVVGVRIAFIAAILAAVTGMYQAIDAGSIAGAPWSSELLNVSTSLSKALDREIGMEFDALKAEADEFEKYKDTQTQLLEKAEDLLNGTIRLDPMTIWGESPNDFYQRTVHSGNIGMVGIEAVSSFVDMRLTLPKLTDTLGDMYGV